MTLVVSTPKLRLVGDNYVVIPFEPGGEIAKWLRKEHVRFPASMKKSRWPTMAELVSVLEAIPGASVERCKNGQSGWDLQISRDAADGLQRAELWLKDVTDLDTPVRFDFHQPSPDLAITIVERLTHIQDGLDRVEAQSSRVEARLTYVLAAIALQFLGFFIAVVVYVLERAH